VKSRYSSDAFQTGDLYLFVAYKKDIRELKQGGVKIIYSIGGYNHPSK